MAAGVSARFKEVVQGSYQMIARMEVLNPAGAVLADSASEGTPLLVVGGSISLDGSASFRRSISDLRLADQDGALVPLNYTALLSPASNNELRLHVGALVDGTPEYVEQGTFHLEGTKVEDTPEGLTITLNAFDRARKYARAKRVVPKWFDASLSTPIYTAITQLLQDAYPGTAVNHDSPAALTPSQEIPINADPWDASRKLAESMGYELYFDRFGDPLLTRIPDPNSATLTADWSYSENTGALLGAARDQTNEGVFNGVVVTGMNPSLGDPVRVVVWDDNPESPTYYLGPYGKVPDFFQSDKIGTVDQATDAGKGRLNRYKGLVETVEFTIVPNPALEPGDGVQLLRARSGFVDTDPLLIVDQYRVNMSAAGGAMTVTCRQRRLA